MSPEAVQSDFAQAIALVANELAALPERLEREGIYAEPVRQAIDELRQSLVTQLGL